MPANPSSRLLLALTASLLYLAACAPVPPQPTPLAPLPTEPPASPQPILPTRTPLPTQPAASSTPAASPVTITAVGGDLAIRTGPDASFPAVDTLRAGSSLPASARSIQDGWLQVPIPSQPGARGWLSTKAGYSRVDGYVLGLPLITAVEWPFGAYLINCTPHRLLVQPGDKLLDAVGQPPSRVWFYPGLYKVYDLELPAQPLVSDVKLFEHTDTRLMVDGSGNKYTCP